MRLLDYYKNISSNASSFDFYTSAAREKQLYSFYTTNSRHIFSPNDKIEGFAKSFEIISKIEGKLRSTWENKNYVGQEVEKQHTVNMRRAEFFNVENGVFKKTSRGLVFEKMYKDESIKGIDKWLLCYILILAGYFNAVPNYVIERTKEIQAFITNAGYSISEIEIAIKSFINGKDKWYESDFLYIDVFFEKYMELDFLTYYKNANSEEKKELYDFVKNSICNKDESGKVNKYKCIIGYKFRAGGQETVETVIDKAKVLFLSLRLLNNPNLDRQSFIPILINAYSELFDNCDRIAIKKFVESNKEVFDVIFCKLINDESQFEYLSNLPNPYEIKVKGDNNVIDTTNISGIKKQKAASEQLKNLAKLESHNKCVLEDCESCKYFTSKESKTNYLEVHHFIPRAFANDFDVSIEIIENYVALCPNCHRKIHLAVDREREHMIKSIWNKRKDKLIEKGLVIRNIEQIFEYYHIDKE